MRNNRKNESSLIQLRNDRTLQSTLQKLNTNRSLSYSEKTYLLSCAIIFIKKYESDRSLVAYLELAYYIILKYSIYYKDFEPLLDYSMNLGLYPLAYYIANNALVTSSGIAGALLDARINGLYGHNGIIETLEQQTCRKTLLSNDATSMSFIAPTSFGKSRTIIEHLSITNNKDSRKAIIVPTKSLLAQTASMVRKEHFAAKIITHDEMFSEKDGRIIAILTQERAFRLLQKHNIAFDVLYIDEAQQLLNSDYRSILLTRLIKLNRIRNSNCKIVYLSPVIASSHSLSTSLDPKIKECKINLNLKEPEYYEYKEDGTCRKYDRFLNTFYDMDNNHSSFLKYLIKNASDKTFCFVKSPRKIEKFAIELIQNLPPLQQSEEIDELINILKQYIHEDFLINECLSHGVLYLHGKLPDEIRDYLTYKFTKIKSLRYIIANNVILEGVNLPIDSLFIFSCNGLEKANLVNLIGRVNRLNTIFSNKDINNLNKLMPQVHFVNNTTYNRKNGKMENKIKLLRWDEPKDKIENPLLDHFNMKSISDDKKKEKYERIVSEDKAYFTTETLDETQKIKKKLLASGASEIYLITDELCKRILKNIYTIKEKNFAPSIDNFLEVLQKVFVTGLEDFIVDEEFRRLQNTAAISYYKTFIKNMSRSLKERITYEITYYNSRIASGNPILYVGESYGEMPYPKGKIRDKKDTCIDISKKTPKELANIAITKQKIESDFVSYKIYMLVQIMLDYNIINEDLYNVIVYGTSDKKKIELIKMGLSSSIINMIIKDGQLGNINLDEYGNISVNNDFLKYREELDDYLKYEIGKYL